MFELRGSYRERIQRSSVNLVPELKHERLALTPQMGWVRSDGNASAGWGIPVGFIVGDGDSHKPPRRGVVQTPLTNVLGHRRPPSKGTLNRRIRRGLHCEGKWEASRASGAGLILGVTVLGSRLPNMLQRNC